MSFLNIFLISLITLIAVVSIPYIIFYFFNISKYKNKATLLSILFAFSVVLTFFDFALLVPFTVNSITNDNNNVNEEEMSYDDFNVITPEEVFNSKDKLVYFYSNYCSICKEIKNDVLSFYKNNSSFYLLDIDTNVNEINMTYNSVENCINSGGSYEDNYCTINYSDYLSKMEGISDIRNFYLIGTPTLIEVKDGVLNKLYLGGSEILNLIQESK